MALSTSYCEERVERVTVVGLFIKDNVQLNSINQGSNSGSSGLS